MNAGDGIVSDTLDWLPAEAWLIAVIRETGSGKWAAGVAVGLADSVGRKRGRTYLANVGTDGSELDSLLEVEGGPGLTSALTGPTSVASIARSAPQRSFTYLPAGDSGLPLSELRRLPTFRRLLRKMRNGGGTLLLYGAEEDLPAASRGDAVDGLALDGCIALGSVRDLALELGAPLLARVERPAEPPVPPVRLLPDTASSDIIPDLDTVGKQHESIARFGSLSRLLIPVFGLLVLWMLWTVARSSEEAEAAHTDTPPATVVPSVGGPGKTFSPDAASRPLAWRAPAANYSVLVGSYIRLHDAEDRRDRLSGDGGLFYVSPTPVRGRIYYRVFAGVHEDQVDAMAAMERLVADGRKKAEKLWDVRPVRLAYDLGTFDSMDGASDHVRAMGADGIPAYVLGDLTDAPAYRVFAGAFESEEAAMAMGDLLASRGLKAELITRSGIAP